MDKLCLLLYEPNHTGHHYAYLARLLPGFLALPVDITVATTEEGMRSGEFQKSLAVYRNDVCFAACCTPSPKGTYAKASHRLQEFVRIVAQIKPQHAGIMYADAIWELLAIRWLTRTWPLPEDLWVEAWLYRGGFSYPNATGLQAFAKRKLFVRTVNRGPFAALNLNDDILFDFALSHRASNSRTRVALMPDPIELHPHVTLTVARSKLGLVAEGRIVGSLGMIDRRKGADLLLDAFQLHVQTHPSSPDRLLLAGPHSKEIRELLAADPYQALLTSQRIISRDGYLSGTEFFDYAAICDLVAAPYPHHSGRSSVILWAAAAGRPSLGTAWGCIGHVISTKRLGIVCNVLDRQALSSAIAEGLAMAWTPSDEQRVREYAEFHSSENYSRIASSVLRERIESLC